MNPTPLRRSLAAVATTIACLVMMATPAAATTHDVVLTGGRFRLVKTGVNESIEPAPATPTCPTVTSALDLDVTGTDVSVTALDIRDVWSIGPALRTFSRSPIGNSPGTLSGTTLTSMSVGVLIDFYPTYDAATCTPTGSSSCTLAFIFNLSGTMTGTTASSTLSLTGSSSGNVTAFTTCAAGPSVFAGTTVAVTTDIPGHLTT